MIYITVRAGLYVAIMPSMLLRATIGLISYLGVGLGYALVIAATTPLTVRPIADGTAFPVLFTIAAWPYLLCNGH